MLVKLGNMWVDPYKVVSISAETGSFCVNVHCACGSFFARKGASYEDAISLCDEYSCIVNNSLVIQSFGGETDASEKV